MKTKTITNIPELKNEFDIFFNNAKDLIGVNPSIGVIDKSLLSDEDKKMVKERIRSRNGKLFYVI